MTRRAFVFGGGIVVGSVLGGCTAARFALAAAPSVVRNSPETTERTLRAFVMTVVPVADAEDPNLVRVFSDPYYSFLPHRDLFVRDLRARSKRLRGAFFEHLCPKEREEVLADTLAKGGIRERLYRAAILLAQASFYGGIYGGGCRYLGVPPEDERFHPGDLSYPDATKHMAREATADGNPT